MTLAEVLRCSVPNVAEMVRALRGLIGVFGGEFSFPSSFCRAHWYVAAAGYSRE
jgi:hypothetical protein